MIKQKADEGADFLKRRGEELRDTASEYVDRGRTVLSRQRDNISAAMDAGKAAYREAITPEPRSASAGGAEGI